MKVAIIHDWLVNYGGGERVVEQLLMLYPDADIFTLVYDKQKMERHFPPQKVRTSFVQRIPGATHLYTKFLSLMPRAFESFDLSVYDLVIASSSSCAKGVIVPPTVPFIAYIHTPMRYAWDLYHDYYRRSGMLTRFFMRAWIPQMRQWDYISSQRIDSIICNSQYIARRIRRFWNRTAQVIYPPVDTERLGYNGLSPEPFYLVFSRFVPYKRIDIAIQACGHLKRQLVVLGGGGQEKALKALAAQYHGAAITFAGRLDDEAVKGYLQRCRALLFCAEEDFGIIPVEAQACGRPVIAYGKGGARETVIDGKTGVFFERQTADSLEEAILRFERLEAEGTFAPEALVRHAAGYGTSRFRHDMQVAIERARERIQQPEASQ